MRHGFFIWRGVLSAGFLSAGFLATGPMALPARAQEAAQDAAGDAQSEILSGTTQILPEVVVTASPFATALDEMAAPVTVVTRDEIVASPASTIGALLKDKPGITESSFAAGASRPIIRGLDNTRVRVQENGIGSADVSAVSEDHGVPIDPFSAKRVEVVRGPATLRYGSEAIGGVVNIINERIPTRFPKEGFDGVVSLSHDWGNDGRSGSGGVNARTGNVVWHADGFARKTDDYRIPGRGHRQDETWTETSGVSGGASYFFDADEFDGYVGAALIHYDSKYGIPAPEDPANPVHIDMNQTKLQVMSELDFPNGPFSEINVTGGYSDYTHSEIELAGATGSRFDNKEWEGRAELLHRAIGPFTGAIGVQAHGRDLSAAGEGGELLAPAETDAAAAFIFEEMPLMGEMLKLQVAGRAEQVNVTGTGFDTVSATEIDAERGFTPLSASAG
ncbi:MAG: TonB-dependent receptor, partial [Alphaproteobacteria bacterium HGW-Alphaproteobacteria-12]